MAMMRALQQTTLDGPGDLRLIDTPVPVPGPGELLVRVTAAGINFADVMQTRGTYAGGPSAPYLAGFEAAGRVVALGPGVTGPRIGTAVVGTGHGAFAEYMTMPAAEAISVPAGWADEQALGLVLNWATALAALKPLGRVAPGENVLIHAAAGGVGQAAVRMAKHYGATVIAVTSAGKHATVRGLGADHVLERGAAGLAAQVLRLTGGAGADLVLESAGGGAFAATLAATRRVTGRVVVYGFAGGAAAITSRDLVFDHPVQVIGLHIGTLAREAPEMFAELRAELVSLRAARVHVPGRPAMYDLADGPKVLAELEAGSTTGKLALRP
ncbi:zinc-binding dehydrogenase [Actinoplanes aureus]|uniref:Zinc-binding dehydrogenase n=1 Tax=Actinoplanes aureus TaxID=2792083 RepID=A0A931FY53_9ACTN|nr:zinc-binding dehydrogenase [Actinoplanes aureus]MBG0564223.1 zinc-binding dehydrogenase [Actinoplanes aureus]